MADSSCDESLDDLPSSCSNYLTLLLISTDTIGNSTEGWFIKFYIEFDFIACYVDDGLLCLLALFFNR